MVMKALYEPTGRAKEYADLAVNTYRGCSHGCTYCYAPAATHRTREQFAKPEPRIGILEALEQDCAGRKDIKRAPVLLSFSHDPYMPIEAEHKLTRGAIEILHRHGFPVIILTKAGALAQRDFDLLGPQDKFGVTLTTLSMRDAAIWEPQAALPLARVANLVQAYLRRIPTWVSCEPVLDPFWTSEVIKATSHYVDEYKIGTWNHDVRAKEIDWPKFARDVVKLLDSLGKRYYLKADLREKGKL